jgi:hypothetical protein
MTEKRKQDKRIKIDTNERVSVKLMSISTKFPKFLRKTKATKKRGPAIF